MKNDDENTQASSDCQERLVHPLYTPGPWVADGERVKDVENECWIADCNVSSFLPVEEIPGNVRLIACAPQMVEALKLAKRGFDYNGYDMEAYDAVLSALNAALGDSWMNID